MVQNMNPTKLDTLTEEAGEQIFQWIDIDCEGVTSKDAMKTFFSKMLDNEWKKFNITKIPTN